MRNKQHTLLVGTVVPRGHIHMVAMPQTLIRIQPRWQHYYVYNNEIVIVDPRSNCGRVAGLNPATSQPRKLRGRLLGRPRSFFIGHSGEELDS